MGNGWWSLLAIRTSLVLPGRHLLVMPRDTALAPAAMLASQRSPDHARNTKVGLVKLPETNQLVDDGLLFRNAIHLGNKSWIVHHAPDVEPCRQGN